MLACGVGFDGITVIKLWAVLQFCWIKRYRLFRGAVAMPWSAAD